MPLLWSWGTDMEWALLPLKRYATFSGRSRRKEFWLFLLFLLVVSTALSIVDSILGFRSFAPETEGVWLGARGGPLSSLFALATLIPNLAVSVRRLHDTDRTGWWLLAWLVGPIIVYVPLLLLSIAAGRPSIIAISAIVGVVLFLLALVLLLVFFCLPGTTGPNRYGDDPLGQSPEALGEVFR